MFARMSRARIKQDRKAEVEATIANLERRTRELPGVEYWISLLSDDGELTVLSAYIDRAACQQNASVNTTRWAEAQHLFQEPPRIIEGEILGFVRAR